ncbi:chaperonin-like RBCX protein 1, chloroplastic [Selaginella moellendorffii]|uniref:chaperonin-like RBCX protein 1, chloroplastic n=1 Tax=Selaginella moellendorffii TaxID=88036 RepID=UPI000D1CD539|nr:chaperonin-like RBCX protein 1, chloroplastic [Selaginella moellendorffii]|eukprot:XP_024519514.1 chaperonin-like RBCX protein 1, chloroplastic [Selaginella moellendorffii]
MATCAAAAAAAAASGGAFGRGIGKAVTSKAISKAGRARVACNCHKMFVPGFGGRTPEGRAADTLHNFFTYIAVKIVASQLEDYNKEAYDDLMKFLDKVPLKDGDKFCSALMRESGRHKALGKRLL